VIRLRPGRGWRLNPALLSELRDGGRNGRSTPEIRDVLSLEVDGVDLLAGLSEDSLLEVIAELARSVARLISGSRCARVACSGGGVELLLERRGSQLLLSLVRLQRPARVTVSDLELDLPALAQAVLEGGRLLLRDLMALHPSIIETQPARHLARALKALAGQKLLAPDRASPRARAAQPLVYAQSGPQLPAVRLELEDRDARLETFAPGTELHSLLVKGRLVLRVRTGGSDFAAAGHPFLLLRDLGAAGLDMVRALEAGDSEHMLPLADGVGLSFDLRAGLQRAEAIFVRRTARGPQNGQGGAFPCPVLPLLTALFEAGAAFAAAAIARNPLQRQNRYLVELSRSAEEGLSRCAELRLDSQPRRPLSLRSTTQSPPATPAHPPVVPGRLRRLGYETVWKSAKPHGVNRLFLSGNQVVAIGEGGAWGLDARSGAGAFDLNGEGALAVPCGSNVLAALGRSVRRVATGGRLVWSGARFGLTSPATSLAVCSGVRPGRPLAAVASSSELVCFSPARGTPIWRFTPPGCSGLTVSAVAGLFLLATSDGRLYGISAARGKIAWRVRCGAGLSTPPLQNNDELFVAVRRPEGPTLLRLGLRDGHELPIESPGLSRLSGLATLPGLPVLAAGTTGGEGSVIAFGEDGRVLWRFEHRELVGPGTPLLTAVRESPQGVLVRGGRALTLLDREGKVRWSHPLSEELHGGISPVVMRGVVFAAGDLGLFAFDLESGLPLGGALSPSLYPVGLAVDRDLTLYLAEEEGPIAALHVKRFLALV
jgi:outer membrane protein assembly factor BamB